MSIREPTRQTDSLDVVPTFEEYENDDAHAQLDFHVRRDGVREGWNGPWAVLVDHSPGVNPDNAWIHIDRESMVDVER